MMRCELESLVGTQILPDDYDVIEDCYMNYDYLFPNKQSVAEVYNLNGFEIFWRLHKELKRQRRLLNLA